LQVCNRFTRAEHVRNSSHVPHVCIIGSGPGGFYTAQQLLKGHDTIRIDMYDKLPVPFGLVRFGVAPDHPEVKNCINTFTNTASNPRCQFMGNVSIGEDVRLRELQEAYHAVVLSYGAAEDRLLHVPGENLKNILSARKFVGWYNGVPEDSGLRPDLDTEEAAIIGHGNVALDVARMLLTPVDQLKVTDMTQQALDAISKSRIKRVRIIGRRGPLQVSFTIKELREQTKLPGCASILKIEDFEGIEELIPNMTRPARRLTELMLQTAKVPRDAHSADRTWELMFLRSPVEFIDDGSGSVSEVKLGINALEGPSDKTRAVPTGRTETVASGLVLRSIGYKSVQIDPELPFDKSRGVVPNVDGRVTGLPGVYCCGWVQSGPVGVILTTMTAAFATGKAIVQDIKSGGLPTQHSKLGSKHIVDLLQKKGKRSVSFADWKKIDAEEIRRGAALGKPREKIRGVEEMLRIAHG